MRKTFMLFIIICFLTLVGCGSNASEYRDNLQDVADKMLDNATVAEAILNQYANVWSFSIKSKGAIPVDEMVTQTGIDEKEVLEHFAINSIGNIPNDFSTNIHSLTSYYTSTGELEEIEKNSEDIKEKINELNDPPSEYEKVYDEALDMYTYSEEYIGMALDPTGSLQEFNETSSRLSSEIIGKYKRIEAIMPSNN